MLIKINSDIEISNLFFFYENIPALKQTSDQHNGSTMSIKLNHPQLLKTDNYIAGKWISSASTFTVTNPATGQIIAKVANAGATETQQAINAAKQAFPEWKSMPARIRSDIMMKWYELILEHIDDLAYLMTVEQGKPLKEARGEVLYGASFIQWFAEEAVRIYGDTIPSHVPNKSLLTIKQPIGVCAAITPWNFPNAMLTRKAGAAFAVGCTMVVKPSEETPLSALALGELATQAGFPPGVFNIVVGTNAQTISTAITNSKVVRKLSFTGSTAVGKLLMAECAKTVKRTSMELGGNAPFIVFDQANIDDAVTGLMASKFRNAGQTCVCANRILVQESIYEEFVQKVAIKIKALHLGNGLDEKTDIGPLINQKAIDKVNALVTDALDKGGILHLGERDHQGSLIYPPALITGITADMDIAQAEIFAPVVAIMPFKTEEQALDIANRSDAGLASYIYTENIHQIMRVSQALEYGIVGINEGVISTTVAPFGGIKQSGMGREGSKYGVDEYLEIKYLCMNIKPNA